MEKIVNVGLLINPVNWLIVTLMIAFAGLALGVILPPRVNVAVDE